MSEIAPSRSPGFHARPDARPRRRRLAAVAAFVRPRTRPDRVRALAVPAGILCVVLGVLTAGVFGNVAGGLRQIGGRSDPEVLATTDLYYRLNDMDAQVANVLLVGAQHGLGVDRQQAQAIYEQDRRQADRDVQRADAIAGSQPSAQRPPARGPRRARPLRGAGRRGHVPRRPGSRPRRPGRLPPRCSSTGRPPTCSRAASCPPRTCSPRPARSPSTGLTRSGAPPRWPARCGSPRPAWSCWPSWPPSRSTWPSGSGGWSARRWPRRSWPPWCWPPAAPRAAGRGRAPAGGQGRRL